MRRGVIFIIFGNQFFYLPTAVGAIFFAWGKYFNYQRMNYAPKTTLQIEETVCKVDTTRRLMDTTVHSAGSGIPDRQHPVYAP